MHRVETTISVADVQQVVQQIADRFRPQMVILFGSYAHGTPTADSDLDLLVVMSDPPPWRQTSQMTADLRNRFPIPLQIHFMDTEAFEESKDVVGGLAYPAYHWGRVLYDKAS
jgi:uncharacterized protein